ncbi:hypothetical protein FB45DRAFT_861023 [Roridomyces roridus]|uniref:Uncharacterized protein n=1 Tax=Roridomyces roridus TaxID=1738132 RepID=A0AAD7FXH8_9AGAR|nr:hypothetical protein FB45DRAFT_861023 [Roridomyces roridus]
MPRDAGTRRKLPMVLGSSFGTTIDSGHHVFHRVSKRGAPGLHTKRSDMSGRATQELAVVHVTSRPLHPQLQKKKTDQELDVIAQRETDQMRGRARIKDHTGKTWVRLSNVRFLPVSFWHQSETFGSSGYDSTLGTLHSWGMGSIHPVRRANGHEFNRRANSTIRRLSDKLRLKSDDEDREATGIYTLQRRRETRCGQATQEWAVVVNFEYCCLTSASHPTSPAPCSYGTAPIEVREADVERVGFDSQTFNHLVPPHFLASIGLQLNLVLDCLGCKDRLLAAKNETNWKQSDEVHREGCTAMIVEQSVQPRRSSHGSKLGQSEKNERKRCMALGQILSQSQDSQVWTPNFKIRRKGLGSIPGVHIIIWYLAPQTQGMTKIGIRAAIGKAQVRCLAFAWDYRPSEIFGIHTTQELDFGVISTTAVR